MATTIPTRLNDLFSVIHNTVSDHYERKMLLKTLRMMIDYRDRLVVNNMLIDVAKTYKETLKNRIAMYDRECAGLVDAVLAFGDTRSETPAIPSFAAASSMIGVPLTLVMNAVGFDKVIIDYGNGRQVTLASI